MSSRQQQRQLERALTKRGAAAISAGLPATPQKDDIVAVAFALSRQLADTAEVRRASRAAAQMHALNEASVRRTPGTAKLACARGCGYCCHGWVGATAPEVFLLAGEVCAQAKRQPEYLAEVVSRCRNTAGKSIAERFGAKLPCPLLVDNACQHYRDRPAVCRQATSFDVAACIDEFEGRGFGGDITVSAIHLAHTRNARIPLTAALRIAGLDARTYELSGALARALETDDAEARWLGGHDVFGGIVDTPADAATERAVAAIIAAIAI